MQTQLFSLEPGAARRDDLRSKARVRAPGLRRVVSMLRYTPCDAENPNPGAPHAAFETHAAN